MSVPGFDPRGDFALVADGLASYTLVERSGTETVLNAVLRRAVSTKEAAPSGGNYRMGDVWFHLSTGEWAAQPSLGAYLRDGDGAQWTFLEVHRETLSDRWKCLGRNLQVSEGLTDLLTILIAGDNERTAAGALRPNGWFTEAANVIGRISPDRAERRVEHDEAHMPETAIGVLLYAREIDGTRRIQQADGSTWKIMAVTKKDRIDTLLELELERTPWPLS